MALVDFLLEGAEAKYAPSIAAIAYRWDRMLGPHALDGVDDDTFLSRVLTLLEARTLPPDTVLQVIADVISIAWWRGPQIDDVSSGRLSALARRVHLGHADGISLPPLEIPLAETRRAHVVFVGDLVGPFHSPSRGAIDYVAALALDPDVKRIDIYHGGKISDEMRGYIDERLGATPRARGLSLVSVPDTPEYMAQAIRKGPCTFHFWCEPSLAPHITIASRLGPTVMFTCGDEPPIQFADVFWYFHEPEHMAPIWRRRGAPESFIRNYVHSVPGPFYDLGRPQPRSRADVGLSEDAFVIATVGNRLGVDLDESFVTGLEGVLRERPQCIWMVVGEMPEPLLDACHHVLGEQFVHIRHDPQLARLMTAVDVFANPFRNGGGNSAMIALTAGAVVLTMNSGDVASMAPPDHRATDDEDYFDRLAMLIDQPGALDAWRGPQRARMRVMTDQTLFLESLKSMTVTAHERFVARRGRSLTSVVEA